MIGTWIRRNDIGYPIRIAISDETMDLTQAVSIEVQVMKPNGEEGTWAIDEIQSRSVIHIIREGDIDILGYYILKVSAQMPDDVRTWPEPNGIRLEVLPDA